MPAARAQCPGDRASLLAEAAAPPAPPGPIAVHDETLRDGLQSPSVTQPALEAKIELLHFMHRLGVDSVDLGMPVSSRTAREHVLRLAGEVVSARLPLSVACAARTTRRDIAAVARIAQRAGLPAWVMTFVGSSPIRMYAERWSAASVLREVTAAVAFARREGLRVCLVTEDTTRSRPEIAAAIYAAGLEAGAERICVCDTVGYATPWSAGACVRQLRDALARRGFAGTGIDWHGHNDRGLAVANSLAAAAAGADRLHGTALGIGERAGNAAMEQLLANLCDLGWRAGDLAMLPCYCELAGRICRDAVPPNQPFVGADVYRTVAGVHAAAIRKAQRRGGRWLAERIYAGIPASAVGREQVIEVGPGSGRANILAWLDSHQIAGEPRVVRGIQEAADRATRVLSSRELIELAASLTSRGRRPSPKRTPEKSESWTRRCRSSAT